MLDRKCPSECQPRLAGGEFGESPQNSPNLATVPEFSRMGESLGHPRIMHKFSTMAPKPSALTALRDPQAGAPGPLDVPYSTPAVPSVARGATHSGRRFRRLATKTYA